MSFTVRPPLASAAACFDVPPPLAAARGAWERTTVVVLPVSIVPVPRRMATITATTTPPSAPASRFALPFTTEEGRGARLIRSKTGVGRDGEETAEARKRAAAVRERAAQC